MNSIEQLSDDALLQLVLDCDRLTDADREVFEIMLGQLQTGDRRSLSIKQRQWVRDVAARLDLMPEQALNLWSSGQVMAGRPVETPDVLRRLPKAPPGRRA
jgi:hypothetical protein